MKKNKIIILVVIVIIYVMSFFVVFVGSKGKNNKKKKAETKYVVVDNFARLSFSDNSWQNVSTSQIENYKNYKVFINNSYFGNYRLEYGSTWNLFNSSNDYVDYEGSLFAYSDNLDIT